MNTSFYNYNINNIINKNNINITNYICINCNIFTNNLSVCSKCQKNICYNCIEIFSKYNINCLCNLNIKNRYFNIPKYEKEKILKLKFKCKNFNKGCLSVHYFENIEEHEIGCEYSFYQCMFPNCDNYINLKSDDNHIDICPYKVVTCEYCKYILEKDTLDNHLEKCPSLFNICNYCKKIIEYDKYIEHISKCKNYYILCDKCNTKLYNSSKDDHTETKCYSKQIITLTEEFNNKKMYIENEILKLKQNYEKSNKIISHDEEIKSDNCNKNIN